MHSDVLTQMVSRKVCGLNEVLLCKCHSMAMSDSENSTAQKGLLFLFSSTGVWWTQRGLCYVSSILFFFNLYLPKVPKLSVERILDVLQLVTWLLGPQLIIWLIVIWEKPMSLETQGITCSHCANGRSIQTFFHLYRQSSFPTFWA